MRLRIGVSPKGNKPFGNKTFAKLSNTQSAFGPPLNFNEHQVAELDDPRGKGSHIVTSHGDVIAINHASKINSVRDHLRLDTFPQEAVVSASRNHDGTISMHTSFGRTLRTGL